MSIVKTAVETYKLLPKTNCGKCGTPTCFGFAAKLASHLASPDDCPVMTEAARKILHETHAAKPDSPGTVYEQALEALKRKIKAVDFKKASTLFGADYLGPEDLEIMFLNERYRVTKEKILDASGSEPRPWISILIYNHLCMPDPPEPSGEWISFGAIPQSHAKDKAWISHVEEVVAKHFSGNVAALRTACERLGGVSTEVKGNQDAAYGFRFFPRYPVLLLFYDEVPEENFPAQCKMLLDRNVPHYLDIESIVVLGEEFAARLTG
ncbi:MAG TPA: DUF3786 domain-containing protein [Nitrospirota bacterium]|nr:DUF3786 domain-containing protein [Nitrospirota bacterium]